MPQIIIIDDEADTRLLLRMILERLGFDVEEAGDGAEGLDAIKRGHPDAVLLDIRMPELDGWQVLDAVRADPTLADVKIVMISAHTSPSTLESALEKGATAFVTKPFRWEQITEAVQRALAG